MSGTAIEIINPGSGPNAGDGESLRSAILKANKNFRKFGPYLTAIETVVEKADEAAAAAASASAAELVVRQKATEVETQSSDALQAAQTATSQATAAVASATSASASAAAAEIARAEAEGHAATTLAFRDQALSAVGATAVSAAAAAQSAVSAADSASGLDAARDAAEGHAAAAQAFRDQAQGHADAAAVAAGTATEGAAAADQSASSAASAEAGAEAARNAAEAARDDAIAAAPGSYLAIKADTEAARDATQVYRDEAEAFRDAAQAIFDSGVFSLSTVVQGDILWNGYEIAEAVFRDTRVRSQDLGAIENAIAIDLRLGSTVRASLVGDAELSLVGVSDAVAEAQDLELHLENPGGYGVTWPQGTRWDERTPSLPASGLAVIRFKTVDQGSTWLASVTFVSVSDILTIVHVVSDDGDDIVETYELPGYVYQFNPATETIPASLAAWRPGRVDAQLYVFLTGSVTVESAGAAPVTYELGFAD